MCVLNSSLNIYLVKWNIWQNQPQDRTFQPGQHHWPAAFLSCLMQSPDSLCHLCETFICHRMEGSFRKSTQNIRPSFPFRIEMKKKLLRRQTVWLASDHWTETIAQEEISSSTEVGLRSPQKKIILIQMQNSHTYQNGNTKRTLHEYDILVNN